MVETAARELEGTGIPVAAVAAGFPHGLSPLPQRLDEIRASVAAGANEIDIVITRGHVLTGNWQELYDEVREMRETLRPRTPQNHPCHWRAGHAAQRGQGQHGRDDGGL